MFMLNTIFSCFPRFHFNLPKCQIETSVKGKFHQSPKVRMKTIQHFPFWQRGSMGIVECVFPPEVAVCHLLIKRSEFFYSLDDQLEAGE